MKPTLFIICGHIGVGKTTTAQLLGKLLKTPVISVDQTIKDVFKEPSNIGKDIPFSDFELKVCYNIFALISKYLLSSNVSIIIDGAFAKRKQRDLLISVAKKLKAPHYVLYVTCPDKLIKERSSKRFKKGKGVGWEAHNILKKKYEPLKSKHLVIDTSKPVEQQLKLFINRLQP